MLTINPQYLKDADGNKSLVVLPVKEFENIMEELEDLEDIRLYDKAKEEVEKKLEDTIRKRESTL